MNRVTLVGRLGADPEVRQVKGEQQLVSLTLATSEAWKDRASGEKKEKTEWHRITVWNEALGRVASQYLRKGSRVLVEGKLETRRWTDKDGNERYQTGITLSGFDCRLILLDPPTAKTESAQAPLREPKPPVGWSRELNDEIPF
jgi:single-strand DNA-binding protein